MFLTYDTLFVNGSPILESRFLFILDQRLARWSQQDFLKIVMGHTLSPTLYRQTLTLINFH